MCVAARALFRIKVWKAESGECVRTLKGHTDLVRSLDFSPSAGLIVSGG